MSMLDALQKAGAVNKKRANKAKQQARKERKKREGNLEKRSVIEAREREEAAAAKQEAEAVVIAERNRKKEEDRQRDAAATARNLVNAWEISYSVSFRTKSVRFAQGEEIVRAELPSFLVDGIEKGSIVAFKLPNEERPVLLPRGAAAKLTELRPDYRLELKR